MKVIVEVVGDVHSRPRPITPMCLPQQNALGSQRIQQLCEIHIRELSSLSYACCNFEAKSEVGSVVAIETNVGSLHKTLNMQT